MYAARCHAPARRAARFCPCRRLLRPCPHLRRRGRYRCCPDTDNARRRLPSSPWQTLPVRVSRVDDEARFPVYRAIGPRVRMPSAAARRARRSGGNNPVVSRLSRTLLLIRLRIRRWSRFRGAAGHRRAPVAIVTELSPVALLRAQLPLAFLCRSEQGGTVHGTRSHGYGVSPVSTGHPCRTSRVRHGRVRFCAACDAG